MRQHTFVSVQCFTDRWYHWRLDCSNSYSNVDASHGSLLKRVQNGLGSDRDVLIYGSARKELSVPLACVSVMKWAGLNGPCPTRELATWAFL